MRPPNLLLKNHSIPRRDLPGAERLRRTHVRRMCASSGHCQNPARRQALDRSHWAIRSAQIWVVFEDAKREISSISLRFGIETRAHVVTYPEAGSALRKSRSGRCTLSSEKLQRKRIRNGGRAGNFLWKKKRATSKNSHLGAFFSVNDEPRMPSGLI
jgi:hypothetical protein